MADEKKAARPAPAPDKPVQSPSTPPPAVKAAVASVIEVPLEDRPNLTLMSVEGMLVARCIEEGLSPEQAAAEAKKRAAAMFRSR